MDPTSGSCFSSVRRISKEEAISGRESRGIHDTQPQPEIKKAQTFELTNSFLVLDPTHQVIIIAIIWSNSNLIVCLPFNNTTFSSY